MVLAPISTCLIVLAVFSTIEANYPCRRHQTHGGKTNLQQTRLKISWPTVNIYLAPHIKQEHSVETKPNRINVIFQRVLL